MTTQSRRKMKKLCFCFFLKKVGKNETRHWLNVSSLPNSRLCRDVAARRSFTAAPGVRADGKMTLIPPTQPTADGIEVGTERKTLSPCQSHPYATRSDPGIFRPHCIQSCHFFGEPTSLSLHTYTEQTALGLSVNLPFPPWKREWCRQLRAFLHRATYDNFMPSIISSARTSHFSNAGHLIGNGKHCVHIPAALHILW